jgi:DNA-binding transcriptional LysR family regulator
LDPEKLRLLLEVAQQGSLSRVALAERTSQPYVSKLIGQLESEWGARLFRRTGRGMVPTDFGQAVLPRIRDWLEESQRLADELKVLAGTAAGEVRVATLPSISSPIMGRLYLAVRQRFPGIRLRFIEGYAEQIESWLQNGQADLGITLRYDEQLGDGDVHLLDFELDLCGPPGDPLTASGSVEFAGLDGLPLVLHSKPGALYRHLLRLFAERGMKLVVALEVNSVSIQRDVAAGGGAYALLSRGASREATAAGRLGSAPVVLPAIIQHLDLSLSRHGPISSATREVAAVLRQTVREATDNGLFGR